MEQEFALIHRAIMDDAANIANQVLTSNPELVAYLPRRPYIPGRFNAEKRKTRKFAVAGQFFRYDPGRTNRAGLTLSIEQGAVDSLPPEAVQQLHRIAHDAMKLSLVRNHDKVGYLVLLDAWNGNNYFDRFSDSNEQLRLL